MKGRLIYNVLLLILPALVNLILFLTVPASAVDRHLDDSIIGAERDLPGSSKEGGTAPKEKISSEKIFLAVQDLGLRLVGTVVADDPRRSFAIIDNRSTQKQQVYREGDRIGQALIKKILRNKVVVETGGGDVVLTMGHEESPVTFPAPQQATRSQAPEGAGSTARLDREEMEPALPDYSQLMRQIRVRPQFQEGQPGGFLIYNIDPDSIFATMGLENGDVVVAVNGEPITTTQKASDFYDALEEGGEVVLEVKRGEETQEVRVEIQ
jgi:general secretion pathway protein C